jgi:hypothetical protein
MEVASYNVTDLMDRLHAFEREFGMSSPAFYRLHAEGLAAETVPPFKCVVWADTCRTVVRMAGVEPTHSRELVPAL